MKIRRTARSVSISRLGVRVSATHRRVVVRSCSYVGLALRLDHEAAA